MKDVLLSTVGEADRHRILEACRPRTYQRGVTVFHEGDPGESLHIIRSGRLAVRIGTVDGETATLSIVGPGDVVGEMALVRPGSERSATVVALEPTQTLALTSSAFATLCGDHPGVERTITVLLADRVDRLNRYLVEALYLSTDRRIARRLVEVSDVYGGCVQGTVVPLTQHDIAGLAGTTRPTVNQTLKKLEEQGAISVFRGGLEVQDPALLRGRAGL